MKDQRLSVDMISTLPPVMLETILCLLPIQEAARTSILSREWRYKWTTIPKLEFNEDTFQHKSFDNEHALTLAMDAKEAYIRRETMSKCRFFFAIYQVLFVHQGPIHEFTLSMYADETYLEIDQVIDHLSKNNPIKKFTLNFVYENSYRLLLSAFSLHQLTDLHLESCAVYLQPSFDGFGSLTCLYLKNVIISQETLLHLLSKCSLLKSLSLLSDEVYIDNSTITRLFECLPAIEYLAVWGFVVTDFAKGVVPRELPTSLVHLKYFSLEEIFSIITFQLPFFAFMMRSSPNLEKLKLHIQRYFLEDDLSIRLEDYSDIWLEHLNDFEFENFVNVRLELEFVRLILAKLPRLKKVRIVLDDDVSKEEEIKMFTILLCSPRASPEVDIIVVGYDD